MPGLRTRRGAPSVSWQPQAEEERSERWEGLRRRWLLRWELSPHTRETFNRGSRLFSRFVAERTVAIPPWWSTRETVGQWRRTMVESGLTEERIHAYHAACSIWFAYALPRFRNEDPQRATTLNPFVAGPGPTAPSPPHRGFWHLQAEELECLFHLLQRRRSRSAARNRALLLTLLLTSARPASVLQMRWRDLHYDGADGEAGVVWREGTDRLCRTVLPVRAYWAICRYLAMDGRDPEQLGPDAVIWTPLSVHNVTNLAPNYDRSRRMEQPISVQALRSMLRGLLRAAGVGKWRALGPVDLQYTFALHLYDHGDEIEQLRRRWGYAHEPLAANYAREV